MKNARRLLAASIATSVVVGGVASAERFSTQRGAHVVVGPMPGAAAVADGIDTFRNRHAARLPQRHLRLAWRKSVGAPLDRAPLVREGHELVLVSARGDVLYLRDDGTERARIALGAPPVAAPALLGDGTLAVLLGNGDVLGIDAAARLRFRTALGPYRGEGGRPSALPTSDGGLVVARGNELAALDGDGVLRARATAPEPIASPLGDGFGGAVFATTAGSVHVWRPTQGEPSRVASVAAPVDDGVLALPTALVVNAAGRDLVALGRDGAARSLHAAPRGSFLAGAPARLPSGFAVLEQGPAAFLLVEVSDAGAEVRRRAVGVSGPGFADAGAPPATAAPRAYLVTDDKGAIAFATPAGEVGVARPDGAIELLSEPPCARSSGLPSRPSVVLTGLVPDGAQGLFVTCDGGIVARIQGEPSED